MAQELSWALEHDTAYLQVVSDVSGLRLALWSESDLWVSRGMDAPNPCETDPTLRALLESGGVTPSARHFHGKRVRLLGRPADRSISGCHGARRLRYA